jgi:ubiquitin
MTLEAAILSAKAQVQDAYGILRTLQQNASKIREMFLEDCAEHLAAMRGGVTKADALCQLIAAEALLLSFNV